MIMVGAVGQTGGAMGLGNSGGCKGQRVEGTTDTMGQIWNTRVTPWSRETMVGLKHHGRHQQTEDRGRGRHQGRES